MENWSLQSQNQISTFYFWKFQRCHLSGVTICMHLKKKKKRATAQLRNRNAARVAGRRREGETLPVCVRGSMFIPLPLSCLTVPRNRSFKFEWSQILPFMASALYDWRYISLTCSHGGFPPHFIFLSLYTIFKNIFYLFEREIEKEREREGGRGARFSPLLSSKDVWNRSHLRSTIFTIALSHNFASLSSIHPPVWSLSTGQARPFLSPTVDFLLLSLRLTEPQAQG